MNSAPDNTVRPGPRPRRVTRRRAAIVVVVVVAVLGAAVVWWGRPQLTDGPLVRPGPGMARADDGIDTTRLVVGGTSGAAATATFTVGNHGHLPFTVHGLDTTEMTTWSAKQQVTFLPGLPGEAAAPAPDRQITLRPGEVATVFWRLDLACRPALPSGGFMSIDSLPFRVSWLGIPATRELPLQWPIAFVEGTTPRPVPDGGCPAS